MAGSCELDGSLLRGKTVRRRAEKEGRTSARETHSSVILLLWLRGKENMAVPFAVYDSLVYREELGLPYIPYPTLPRSFMHFCGTFVYE